MISAPLHFVVDGIKLWVMGFELLKLVRLKQGLKF